MQHGASLIFTPIHPCVAFWSQPMPPSLAPPKPHTLALACTHARARTAHALDEGDVAVTTECPHTCPHGHARTPAKATRRDGVPMHPGGTACHTPQRATLLRVPKSEWSRSPTPQRHRATQTEKRHALTQRGMNCRTRPPRFRGQPTNPSSPHPHRGGRFGTRPRCWFVCLWRRLLASRPDTSRPPVGPNVVWSCQRSPRMTCPVGLLRGSAVPETGLLPVPLTRSIQMHTPSPSAAGGGGCWPRAHTLFILRGNWTLAAPFWGHRIVRVRNQTQDA